MTLGGRMCYGSGKNSLHVGADQCVREIWCNLTEFVGTVAEDCFLLRPILV